MEESTIKPAQNAYAVAEIEDQHSELLQLRTVLRDEIPHYTRLAPWKSYTALAGQWLQIAVLVALALISDHWLVWLLAIVLIAGRQHALGVLGHDASHCRLSRKREVNDFVGDVFCWLPLFFCHSRYAHEHILHHKFVNTGRDPYLQDFNTFAIWDWPKSPRQAAVTWLRMLCGFEAKAMLAPGKRMSVLGKTPTLTSAEKVRAGIFYSGVALFLTMADAWLAFLILWVLPLITLSALFVHWRTVAEHLGLSGPEDVSATRHVDANFFERLTVAPLAVNYHLDHHLFPGVPFYNLPQLHQRLLREPLYCRNAIIKDGYFGRNSVYSDVVVAKHAAQRASASVIKR